MESLSFACCTAHGTFLSFSTLKNSPRSNPMLTPWAGERRQVIHEPFVIEMLKTAWIGNRCDSPARFSCVILSQGTIRGTTMAEAATIPSVRPAAPRKQGISYEE